MSLKRISQALALSAAWMIPKAALALEKRFLTVDFGSRNTFNAVVFNALQALTGIIGTFCGILFLIGALLMVISRGKDDQLQKGKDLMIQSMIGLAVTLSAYAIIRTLFSVLY